MDHWAPFFPKKPTSYNPKMCYTSFSLGAHFQKNQPSPISSRFNCMVALAEEV